MFRGFVDCISKSVNVREPDNQNTTHHLHRPSLCAPSRFHFSHKDPIKLLRPKVDACALGSVCSSIIIIVNGGMEVWAWGRVEMGWGWVAEGGGIFGVQSQERLDGARK